MSTREHHLTPERRRELASAYRMQAAEHERTACLARAEGDQSWAMELEEAATELVAAAERHELAS